MLQPSHSPAPDTTGLNTAGEPEQAPASFRYRLRAQREPSVLPRVVEMFTLRDLIPHSLTCVHCPENADELRLELQVHGLEVQQAESLAARMRNVVPVISVLLEPQF